jgi:post-segregation antitoxin (ccd killing protein)
LSSTAEVETQPIASAGQRTVVLAQAHAIGSSGLAERWLEQSTTALNSSNAYIERHGLPLVRFRRF